AKRLLQQNLPRGDICSAATDHVLPHCKRRMVWPAKRYTCSDGLHWLEIRLPLALIVACVDERHRPFHQLHYGDIAWGAHLQCPELRQAVDYCRRLVCRHCHDLLKRETEAHELAHYPGEVGHSRRVAGEYVDVGRNGVGQAALLNRGLSHRVIETSA